MHELIISATGSAPWRQELAGGVKGDKKARFFGLGLLSLSPGNAVKLFG
jgi:hypothetical protein